MKLGFGDKVELKDGAKGIIRGQTEQGRYWFVQFDRFISRVVTARDVKRKLRWK